MSDIDLSKFGITDELLKKATGNYDYENEEPVQNNNASKAPLSIEPAPVAEPIAIKSDETITDSIHIEPDIEPKHLDFYVLGFLKSLANKDKIGIDIWLVINLDVIILPLWLLSGDPMSLLYTIPAYLFSICLALSPIGEALLRLMNHCKSIDKDYNADVKSRVKPLFEEVYDQAKKADSNISDKIRLFVSDDPSPNAFATGRKTICLNRGLLQLGDEEIKGVLAHEFGHISHKDTDVILVVAVGNMIVNLFILLCNMFFGIFTFVVEAALRHNDHPHLAGIVRFIHYGLSLAIFWIWTKIGVLLCLYSGRKNEYSADKFAVDTGFGHQLKNALKQLDDGDYDTPKGLWANLNASHPDTSDRIAAIEATIY